MWNLIKMWFLVRKLYQLQISEAIKEGLGGKENSEGIDGGGILRAMKVNKLLVQRWFLACEFMRYYEKIEDDRVAVNYEKHVYKNQQLINDAIDRGFIKEEGKIYIHLTGGGSEFRTPTYLVIYLIKELGPIWTVIITTFSVLGISNFQQIKDLVRSLF